MKAITLWQPWASLIAQGFKKIETRSWGTNYRGALLIHAAKRPIKAEDIDLYVRITNGQALDLPLGKIVAATKLSNCVEMSQEFIFKQSDLEIRCGDWREGRWAWELSEIVQVDIGIPVKGKQGLWVPNQGWKDEYSYLMKTNKCVVEKRI